jgi:hypothetical protein
MRVIMFRRRAVQGQQVQRLGEGLRKEPEITYSTQRTEQYISGRTGKKLRVFEPLKASPGGGSPLRGFENRVKEDCLTMDANS